MSKGGLELGKRRGYAITTRDIPSTERFTPDAALLKALEDINVVFRTLASIMYNCVPMSGHPGGSISSSRMVEGLLYHTMDYDFSNPEAPDTDLLCYAAGHKALGLYALWAIRNELVRITHPELLPDARRQLRLEDLLGFRRNPTQHTPLFKKFHAKALDGHPTPATPHVRLSTGASGVGVPASFGLAFGALDLYPNDPPHVHIIEGEGGLTPGRIQEALATVATAQIYNTTLHIDWNQASIDSNHVCRDGDKPGDYVQWDPTELFRLHDFNVVLVEDGMNHAEILAAQDYARKKTNDQPTAIVYRTVKGWRYGIEGRASHGAGHKLCSEDFYKSLGEFQQCFDCEMPKLCTEPTDEALEAYYFELLMDLRKGLEGRKAEFQLLGDRVAQAKQRLAARKRSLRADAPDLAPLFDSKATRPEEIPPALLTAPGKATTLRGALGDVLNHLNHATKGAFIGASADLLGSTSIDKVAKGFPAGYYNGASNPKARLVACGGICEDSMGAFLAALGVDGRHIGAASSYGAFIAALQHVAVRLHGIGQQARREATGTPVSPYIMVCGHAGLKTGEDGPTHADPQCLQLLSENFPRGVAITLTPWDPNEMWPLTVAGLQKRPALLAPYVTRPNETIIDRKALGLPPPTAAAKGLYALRRADPAKQGRGTLVLQESGVTFTFLNEVLPRLDKAGLAPNIYYVASAELFDLLPAAERAQIYPEAHAREAMGITGFTLSTLYRWVTSENGRDHSLHAFAKGHYLGSGQAHKVLEEAGLHGEGQFQAILRYIESLPK